MVFGKHINRYYIKYAPMLLLGSVALLFVNYVQLIIPNLYGLVINGMKDGFAIVDDVPYAFDMTFVLDRICRPMLVVIIIMVIGRFLWRICFFGAGIRLETDLRGRMFDRCKDLSQQYYQVNKVGNLMSLFTNDLETVQDSFSMGILMFVDAAMLGSLSLIKMARMNPLLTLLCLVPLGLLLVASLIVGKYMTIKWDKRQEAFSSLSDFAQESFAGVAVIKAFVKEAYELSRFKKLNRANEDANVDFAKLSVLLNVSLTLLIESVTCIIIGYGGYLVYNGVFDAGQLVEFIGYFNSVIWPIMAVSELINMSAMGKASVKRISALLDEVPDVIDAPDVESVPAIHGDIECRNLTFTYPGGDMPVLTDVSFHITAGENVGIIGRTGSGKTTLVDLILRTYNVPDGTLFIDGIDVNKLPIKTVRGGAAYVPQDNFLFSDTIENNILFATDEGSLEEVIASAKMADVHDNIDEFPEKYQSILGERGVTVSGGQKQRISIARALMKNAAILILDDSVSAVDVKTEKAILQNLRDIRKGKTTILIAHRISTIEKMDKIIFIDNGHIAATGTHESLYETCPDYRTMVDLQKLDDGESGAPAQREEVSGRA